jgi:exodeoxyribonuclease V beta subunit
MLRRLLNDFRVPARLLAAGGSGERSLTDLLHLAELLQQASSLLDGEHALIRHLAEQRRDDASGGEARQVRLESDADLVQVVTIHKSKGLEYPLVFLPFACAFRATKATDLPLKWHDAHGRLQLALTDDALLALADRERLGEDLRKLYVALTRARYATWIGAAPLNELEQRLRLPDRRHLQAGIDALAAGCRTSPIDAPAAGRTLSPTSAARSKAARSPRRAVREHWWIASYSALHTARRAARRDAGRRRLPRSRRRPAPPPPARRRGPGRLLHGFPRGAAVGTFLHEILEWAAGQGFGRVADARPCCATPSPGAARCAAGSAGSTRCAPGCRISCGCRWRADAPGRPRRARHLGGRDGVLGRGA